MKKFFSVLGATVAAIVALVSCQVNEIESATRPMTITASSEFTKTTFNGIHTVWADGDQLHVFYSNGSSWEKAGVFKLSEGEGLSTGKFTCESAKTPSGSATWYAIYTGSSSAVPATPAGSADGDGFVYLGRSNGIDQPAYNDMQKVSSSHCPLYGVAENVASSEELGFSLKQLSSVIEFKVVNNTNGILRVNSLQFNAITDVAGQYYVDVTASEPVFTGVSGKTITDPLVKITEPSDLAQGESAMLYIPVKPFVHTANDLLSVGITGSIDGKMGTRTIELNPTTVAQRTFAAGKIKTVTVNVSGLDMATSTNTVKEVLNGEPNTDYLIEGALVTLVYGKGFFVTDGTGTILAFTSSAPTVKKGDKVTLAGRINSYSGMTQLNRPTVNVESSNNNVSLSPVEWAKEEVDEASTDATCEYVSIKSASFSSVTSAVVKDAAGASSATISMTAGTDPAVTLAKGDFDVTGYIYGCYNGKVYMYVDSAEEVGSTPGGETSEAKLQLNGKNSETLSFVANDSESQLVKVTCDNSDWTVSGTPAWVHTTIDKEASTITVTVDENTGDQRTADLTVNHSTNSELNRTLTIIQGAPQTGGSAWKRVTSVSTLLSGGTFIIGYEAEAQSGLIIPMANTGTLTLTAAGFLYSGSTASSGGKTTIDMSSVSGSSAFEVTIESSSVVDGAVNIKIGDAYLGNTNTKNNAKLFSEASATTAFTPTVGENDVFTLTIAANETYTTLQYNSSAPRFAVYSGGQKNVVIYKKP